MLSSTLGSVPELPVRDQLHESYMPRTKIPHRGGNGREEEQMSDRVLRKPEVERLTGKSSATIYRDIARGSFPRQRRIGAAAVGWLESEVANWIANLPQVGGHHQG